MKHFLSFLGIFLIFNVSAQHDTLEILSWNVFLRPSILNDGQMERVDSIAYYLDQSEADVLVLQEVFHKKASKKLRKKLRDKYPHQTKRGPLSFFGVPSGVVILSRKRLPIRHARHFSFKKATGSDRLAKKGFVRARFRYKKHRIDLIGTHLQAGGGQKRNKIRMSQLNSIKEVIEQPDSGAIQIFAGDFNIDEKSPFMDSLQSKLNCAYYSPTSNYRFTANFDDHELYEPEGSPKWIDFVLTENVNEVKNGWCQIERPTQFIRGKRRRLSDHNPIKTWLILKNQ